MKIKKKYARSTSCVGKIGHRLKSKAQAHAIRLNTGKRGKHKLNAGAPRSKVREYLCPFCGLWHVGHRR